MSPSLSLLSVGALALLGASVRGSRNSNDKALVDKVEKLLSKGNFIDALWESLNASKDGLYAPGINISFIELVRHMILCNSVFDRSTIAYVDFVDQILNKSSFRNSKIISSKIQGEAKECYFDNSEIKKTTFSAELDGSSFVDCKISDCNFSHCTMDGVNLSKSKIERSVLMYCKLENVNFDQVEIKSCIMIECDFAGVDFKGINLSECRISGAKNLNTGINRTFSGVPIGYHEIKPYFLPVGLGRSILKPD